MVTSGHLANERGKEVSTLGSDPWNLALFLRLCPPPTPSEDQNPLALERSSICFVIFIFFFHTHFLLINTFLPQHRSWQGLAGSEYFEYLPNCPPRAYSPSCSACECRSSSRAAQEMTLGFGFDRNLPTSVFFPPHGVYSQPVLKFRKSLHSLMSN